MAATNSNRKLSQTEDVGYYANRLRELSQSINQSVVVEMSVIIRQAIAEGAFAAPKWLMLRELADSTDDNIYRFCIITRWLDANRDTLPVELPPVNSLSLSWGLGGAPWIAGVANAIADMLDDDKPRVKSQRVCLFKIDEAPTIDGIPKDVLRPAQYDVIQTLIEAGANGLNKDELVNKSGHGGAREILTTLSKKDSDWESAIQFAGTTGGRYRIE